MSGQLRCVLLATSSVKNLINDFPSQSIPCNRYHSKSLHFDLKDQHPKKKLAIVFKKLSFRRNRRGKIRSFNTKITSTKRFGTGCDRSQWPRRSWCLQLRLLVWSGWRRKSCGQLWLVSLAYTINYISMGSLSSSSSSSANSNKQLVHALAIYGARGILGEHKRSNSNSSLLRALQTSRLHHISIVHRLNHEIIVL